MGGGERGRGLRGQSCVKKRRAGGGPGATMHRQATLCGSSCAVRFWRYFFEVVYGEQGCGVVRRGTVQYCLGTEMQQHTGGAGVDVHADKGPLQPHSRSWLT